MLSSLDFFSPRPLQECITGKFELKIQPTSGIAPVPSTLEFYAPPVPGYYLDISRVKLRMILEMKKQNGDDLGVGDNNTGVVCNIPDSLFSHVDILLNEKSVVPHPENYSYKSIIQLYSRANNDSMRTHQGSCLAVVDDDASTTANNSAWAARRAPFANSNRVEVITRLKNDICSVRNNLLLLDNVSFRLRLQLHPDRYYLWCAAAPADAFLKIIQAEVKLQYVRINPELAIGVDMMLSSTNARYNYKSTQVKTFTMGSNSKQLAIPITFSGSLPTVFCVTFVETTAFQGLVTQSPYNFVHGKLTRLSIFVNDREYRFTADMTKPMLCTEMYESVSTALGLDGSDYETGNQYTLARYLKGMFGVFLDTSPDSSGNAGESINLPLMGTISVHAEFEEPVASGLTVLCIGEFDRAIEIDQARQIYLM